MNAKQLLSELKAQGLPAIGANDAGRVTLRDAKGERVVLPNGTWAVERGIVAGTDAELAAVEAVKASHVAQPRVKQGARRLRAMEAIALKIAGATMPAWATAEFNKLVSDGAKR